MCTWGKYFKKLHNSSYKDSATWLNSSQYFICSNMKYLYALFCSYLKYFIFYIVLIYKTIKSLFLRIYKKVHEFMNYSLLAGAGAIFASSYFNHLYAFRALGFQTYKLVIA
jgi:hypothetical protein